MLNPLRVNRIRENKIMHTFGSSVRNGKPHQGWDLEAKAGIDDIIAIEKGKIYVAHDTLTQKDIQDINDNKVIYGLFVILQFEATEKELCYNPKAAEFIETRPEPRIKLWALYAHLDSILKTSGSVEAGDRIGIVGRTGYDHIKPYISDHLHFEICKMPAFPPGTKGRIDPRHILPYWDIEHPINLQNSNRLNLMRAFDLNNSDDNSIRCIKSYNSIIFY